MEYCSDMDDKEIENSCSWHTRCGFYADSMGNRDDSGAEMYLCDVTFTCKGDGFETSFKAMDVLYVEKVLKAHVIEYLEGKRSKVRRANMFSTIGAETLTSLELDGGRFIFVKFNNLQFKQLLSIAQAKQKYSKTVADRN